TQAWASLAALTFGLIWLETAFCEVAGGLQPKPLKLALIRAKAHNTAGSRRRGRSHAPSNIHSFIDRSLLQLGVFGLRLLKEWNAWVSVFPECEKVLIRSFRFVFISG